MMKNNLVQLADHCYWDKETEVLTIEGSYVKLTASQKHLLGFLVKNLNRPIHSIDIFNEVNYSRDKEYNEKSVRNLISALRKSVTTLNIVNVYGGYYMLRKDNAYPNVEFKEYLYEILDQSTNPTIITNPNEFDNHIVYVNNAFVELFEYNFEEVVGHNCRFLHKDDSEQLALDEIRNAIHEKKSITVNLHNYTHSGELIYNEVAISPIFDKKSGKLKYYLGVYKDVTTIQRLMQHFKEIS